MKTINYILITLFLIAASSCYKKKDTETIRGTITLIDTVNNVGVSGVNYTIYERKYKKKKFEDIVFMKGETNLNGKADFEFERPKNKKKWGYNLRFNISTVPNNLKYNKSKTYFEYGTSFSDTFALMQLNNVYNEYDNNNVKINFYP